MSDDDELSWPMVIEMVAVETEMLRDYVDLKRRHVESAEATAMEAWRVAQAGAAWSELGTMAAERDVLRSEHASAKELREAFGDGAWIDGLADYLRRKKDGEPPAD